MLKAEAHPPTGSHDLPLRAMLIPAVSALAFLAVLLPLAAAILLAYHQSYAAEREKAQSLAREILRRVDDKRDQLERAFIELERYRGEPCSLAETRRMAGIVLHFEQLQGAGYVRDDRLICTSAGLLPDPIYLGPSEFRTPSGFMTRTGVRLPFAPDVGLVVLTMPSGFALFVHPRLSTDVPIRPDREGVGVVVVETRRLVNHRGMIKAAWLAPFFRTGERTYITDGRLVTVMPSRTGEYAGVATLPIDAVSGGLMRYLLLLLPIGVVCAGLLVLLLRVVVRIESSFTASVKRAFKQDRFYLVYQPIVDLETGLWIGAEALVRWRGGRGQEYRPDLFIPHMEAAGLITLLTDRVFALLARDVGSGLVGRDFYISVNVASVDLRGDRLARLVDTLCVRTGCSPSQFTVEVTERGLVDAVDGRHALEELRRRGVRAALDDFGTGYSSLSYLQNFPIDCIKIDKCFVEAVGTEAPTSSVVRHIINMARDLRFGLIAEGVETEAQEWFLRERGVVYGQGWKFAKPMLWDQLTEQLALRDVHDTPAGREPHTPLVLAPAIARII